jgi:hydroxymethylpyrimidine pyrophosphatase-like HAD family hydrolase
MGSAAEDTLGAPVNVLFSDLDGTLVHYPKDFGEYAAIVAEDDAAKTATIRYNVSGETRACLALTSMTGGKAYISVKTGELVGRLRALGVMFVIITGSRASTYVQRRGQLPEADYEFFENGGRMLVRGKLDPTWTDCFAAQSGPVASRDALLPDDLPPPMEREGELWALYRELAANGWHVDARDYATNFRVDIVKSEGKSVEDFKAAVDGKLDALGLATSFNLGKADIYPAGSGKANAAAHVLEKEGWSASTAVAMFDDDNDLELGALVGRSFLPGVTHGNVLDAMKLHGDRWTLTNSRGFLGTEEALECIMALEQSAGRALAAAAVPPR